METITAKASSDVVKTPLDALIAVHLDLVYSAALRQVRDPHVAEDVTQDVFLIAARKAGNIPPERMAAWLIVVTRFVALSALRAERRRIKHERAVAITSQTMETQTLPVSLEATLDEAITTLGSTERELIIQRYFQKYSIPQIATAMGITDNTASKRIGRALERLRNHYRRRGVQVSADALGAAIIATAVRPAPKALGAQIISASGRVANPAIASTFTLEMFLMTASTKLSVFAVAVLVFLVLLGGVYAVLQLPAPAPAPASNPADVADGNFVLRNSFPEGGRAELIAINNSGKPDRWWSPNGSPISQSFSGADFPGLKDPYGDTRATYQFAVRLTDFFENPDSLYLQVSGSPRTAGQVPLQRSVADHSLYYGAALLYPEQVETATAWIAFSTLPWNKTTLDASGEPQPPLTNIERREKSELSNLFPAGSVNRVYEKDGKTILRIGIQIWGGDDEFTAVAIAKDGSSHAASNMLTGLVTAGDNYNLAFDLPAREVQRFEISVRKFDQYAPFADLSLQPGHETLAKTFAISDLQKHNYFDDAFYEQLFCQRLGGTIERGDIPAATEAAAEMVEELNARRAHLEDEKNSYSFLVDKALPIVTQIHDALDRKDLAAATALLQADSRSGQCLQNALQKLAMIR